MPKLNYVNLLAVVSLSFLSCLKNDTDSDAETTPINTSTTPNILLIIADDLGKDAINGYQEGIIKPNTPHMDALRNKGLLFNNFWVNPTCTPTRSTIITGKYGYHTGVKMVGNVLNTSETILQKHISDQTNDTYATAIVGKWHLSGNNTNFNPESLGIDYYAGLIQGAVDDYYQWQLTEDGISSLQTNYITETFTDLAINWVQSQTKPWFLWLAYNAPHTPFHAPPRTMHNQGDLPSYANGMDPLPYYMAAIEAMDFQIGRFLDTIPEDEREKTVIIFIGDNGTPNQVAQSPYSRSTVKNTLYQGGINTPMIISGAGVSRTGADNQLISGTDLFATIAEISGVNVESYQDSRSFKALLSETKKIRDYQYSEIKVGTTDSWAISNGMYKLILSSTGTEEMYHLLNDPYETTNLLLNILSSEAQTAKTALELELSKIRR